jgi:acetyl-CoA carboxylase biotin carboxyl carrier protein
MSFTMDEIMEVLQIVKECKDSELHIDTGDMKLSIFKGDIGDRARGSLDFSREGTACHARQPEPKVTTAAPGAVKIEEPKVAATPASVKIEETIEEGLIPIKANVTSVFYRKPSPDEPPFVEVGDEVQEDTVICLLEVMKCFRQVTADVRGRVEKICVESGQLVEYGTVMFLIRPS